MYLSLPLSSQEKELSHLSIIQPIHSFLFCLIKMDFWGINLSKIMIIGIAAILLVMKRVFIFRTFNPRSSDLSSKYTLDEVKGL